MAEAADTGITEDFKTPTFKTEYVTYAASNTVKAFAEKRSKWKRFINTDPSNVSSCVGESYCIEIRNFDGSYRDGLAVVIAKDTTMPTYYEIFEYQYTIGSGSNASDSCFYSVDSFRPDSFADIYDQSSFYISDLTPNPSISMSTIH